MCWIINNLNWLLPLFITILFSILNIVIAFCNLKNTKRQAKLQNDSFCFQLFEKRWSVYQEIDSALSSVIISGKAENEDIVRFSAAIYRIGFLFDQDIADLCKQAKQDLLELHLLGEKIEYALKHHKDEPNYAIWCDKERDLQINISDYNVKLTEAMKEYISFAAYKTQKFPKKKVKKKRSKAKTE